MFYDNNHNVQFHIKIHDKVPFYIVFMGYMYDSMITKKYRIGINYELNNKVNFEYLVYFYYYITLNLNYYRNLTLNLKHF